MMRVGLFGPITGAHGGVGVGGVATHGVGLSQALGERGVFVSYLADNRPGAPGAAESVPWGTLRSVRGARGRREAVEIAVRLGVDSFGPLARSWRDPDRTRAGIPVARAWSRAALVAKGSRCDDVTLLHVQQPDYRPLYVRWAGTRPPLLVAVHGFGVAAEDPGGALETIIRHNLTKADATTAPSRFLAEAAIGLGADPETMTVVPNAVDHDLFRPLERHACRRALGLPDEGPLVLFLGRATEMKGAPDLLHAVGRMRERLDGLRVAFVGPWHGRLPDEATRYPSVDAPVVVREGAPREELPSWLGSADVVAVPSRYEGFGLVALEALAAGRPLVVSRVGGLPEVVPDNAGVFIEPGDPALLARELERVLTDVALADRLAAAGPTVAARYSWDAVADSYARVYAGLAERSRPS